ncbi:MULTISPECIES: MCE family protein [Mycobacteriaceae]|uniref:MCE-family protein MCE1A n=1 Tax=Mycolicibacter arupensis TaxID=342002 RepID=A0A0F5MUE6_9MYCO|nr:MCE family protein [Mycolicibacter arupensis]KKB97677.1 MCE-family protein MCE1A [Mycolicibacter arupensis]MCV7277877.1 MCE family protein [Mycolicibacter arupensis]OQZ94019.1 MCE-family protein MCE1A [Mycolicibacter arupensis]
MATGKQNKVHNPPFRIAGLVTFAVLALIGGLVYGQFRGSFTKTTSLTMVAPRAGLVMDPGGPVTYNGVQIGRVAAIAPTEYENKPAAKFTLDVNPKYIKLIPSNVKADILATTLFGNKYVSLTAPEHPARERITSKSIIATSVTTELNTLFETVNNLSEHIDPIKLNLTLHAAAEALTGLGDKLGESLVNGNAILDDVNARMPSFRRDLKGFATLGEVYADGAPDLIGFLDTSVVTVKTITNQQKELDSALLGAAGVGNLGADVTERFGPYFRRQFSDLVPVSALLDEYSPELFCAIRNLAEGAPKVYEFLGGDGYALDTVSELVGPANPYVYPENLPRYNARGGPGGAPGCWQEITHDFWPAPYLVADTGVSQAPYNHFDTGSPLAIDYVWGRQVGDNTINP